ncbi:hypothetical protein B0H19DRAFT_1257697 [Mycena capillaripes]|nr:hypothetical protein B0H19DRAFT_1257697 [Mycena capillaripes]
MSGTSGLSTSPSGPSTSPPAQDAPADPPHKRKYDTLVAELGDAPPVGNGKRAKRDTMDTKGPLEKLLSMAKYFSRGVHPFHDIGLVMHAGSQSRWTVQVFPDPTNTVIVPSIHIRVAVEDSEDASKAPLTPEATAALQALLNGCKLTNGKPALTASKFPRFLR